MRKLLVAAIVRGLGAGAAQAADPVVGVWASEPDDAGNYEHVDFIECGTKICATLVNSFDRSGAVLATGTAGTQVVWDMKPAANGRYKGGQMELPDNGGGPDGDGIGPGGDEPLDVKMRLSGDKLTISACVMGGLVCGGQTWTRVK